MIISDKIEVDEKIVVARGFGDIKIGRHMGHFVAMKTQRVPPFDDLQKLKKVSLDVTISDDKHLY